MPAALALSGMIGNRAVGQLVARTPEDSAELLEPAILGAHVNVEQINRTLLPFSKDQEGFDKMAEAYETKTEVPLKQALETHVSPEDMLDVEQARAVARLPAAQGRRRRRWWRRRRAA